MKRTVNIIFIAFALVYSSACSKAPSTSSQPIDITADKTSFNDGVASGEGNVRISNNGVTFKGDKFQYNPNTHIAMLYTKQNNDFVLLGEFQVDLLSRAIEIKR